MYKDVKKNYIFPKSESEQIKVDGYIKIKPHTQK